MHGCVMLCSVIFCCGLLCCVMCIGATTLWDPWDASPPTFEQVGTVPPTFENFQVNKSPKCTPFGIKSSKLRRLLGLRPRPRRGSLYDAPPYPWLLGASCLRQLRLCAFR